MDEFPQLHRSEDATLQPERVRAVYNKQLGLFSITALDGVKRGKVIDYVPLVYLGAPIGHPRDHRDGPCAPVTGKWLPSAVGNRLRLSLNSEHGDPQVLHREDEHPTRPLDGNRTPQSTAA